MFMEGERGRAAAADHASDPRVKVILFNIFGGITRGTTSRTASFRHEGVSAQGAIVIR